MKKMILVLDESGAKGYASTREKFEGEFGLMAGFLYTEPEMDFIKAQMEVVLARHCTSVVGKFHIADLSEADQASLRDGVFELINKTKLQWFYQAISAEGFHQSEFSEGRGGFKDKNESLHVALFKGMFIKAMCMAKHLDIRKLDILVKTDPVDSGVLERFKKSADSVINILLGKGDDYYKKVSDAKLRISRREKVTISVKSEDLPGFDEILFGVECECSPLTVLADVLANSTYYYLRVAQKNNHKIALNSKRSIEKHPAYGSVFGYEGEDHILDVIYRRVTDEER